MDAFNWFLFPGFNLWTSAHGFHHLSLTQSKGWKCFWGLLLLILCLSLIGCIAFYFYFVFSSAIYSRFLLDSPTSMNWPTTIVCDRQVTFLFFAMMLFGFRVVWQFIVF